MTAINNAIRTAGAAETIAAEIEVAGPPAPKSYGAPQRIVYGRRKAWAELGVRLSILRVVLGVVRRPGAVLRALRMLDAKRRQVLGDSQLCKFMRVDGRYYWDMYTPGWPSKAFDDYIRGEVARIIPLRNGASANRFTNIFLAITKKCPLQCEHCFEWDALNGREVLTRDDLHSLVRTFQDRGTGIIQFTGGEPMLRLDDLLHVLGAAKAGTDFWVLTSGFKFTPAAAKALKGAGLTGVAISLDHYDGEMHNAFRGFRNAYAGVEEAVCAAKEAGLVVALSLCATQAFVSSESLERYLVLAQRMGVSFVQILEPKAVGHYKGQAVALTVAHEKVLQDFYLRSNYDPACKDFPIVTYHGYHQRQVGCFGAGNRNLYVDTDGDVHACPFCQMKRGSALRDGLDAALQALQIGGCHGFRGTSL